MARALQILRAFNTVALAIVLLIAIPMLAVMAFSMGAQLDDLREEAMPKQQNDIRGEKIDTGDRQLTLYQRGALYEEGPTDLRFVDLRNGDTFQFSDDPKRRVFGGKVLGIPQRQWDDTGYGYLGLVQTGERGGKPVFDLTFLRFKDMQRFVVVSGVLASDPVEIDAKSFSSVIWDIEDRARFIIFDSEQGRIVTSRDLGMQGGYQAKPGAGEAPKTVFE